MRRFAAAVMLAAVTAIAADAVTIAPFSSMVPGDVRSPWRELTLPNIKVPKFSLVADEGTTVLAIRAESAAGSVAHMVDADPSAMLSWRWKVDRVLERADMTRKAGDDFSARVYVFFDLPLEELSFIERLRMEVARVIYGRQVPSAALCYVWDNRQPIGTVMPNPYTERVRMVVLESGPSRAAQWVEERRNIEEDYRRAFAPALSKAVPKVSGIAASADTDQTGESVTAWFGDFKLEPRP